MQQVHIFSEQMIRRTELLETIKLNKNTELKY